MKKFAQLLLTALAAFSMILASLGSVTAFANADTPSPDERFDIVLTKVKLESLADWNAPTGKSEGLNGTKYVGQKIEDMQGYFGTTKTLDGVWFELHKDTAKGEIVKQGLTENGGIIKFEGLEAGKYVIVENKEKSTLAGEEELAEAAAVPMEITLPVYKAEGGWYKTGTEAVHVYPKNTVAKPTIKKVVNESDLHETTDLGQEKTFTISSTMPAGIKDYKTLTFDDTFSQGLSYAGSFKVLLNEETVQSNAYQFTPPAVGQKGAHISVVFNEDFIKTLKEGDVIKVKYNATVNEDAILGGANPNKIKLIYGNNPNVDKKKETTPPENPELHTGGKRFVKIDKADKTPLPEAKFVVKNSEGKYLKQTLTNGKVTKNDWLVAASVEQAVKDGATQFVSGTRGEFEVVGLAYGKAGQTASEGQTNYELLEIEAPKGYAKLTAPITFTVSSTSYYQNPTEIGHLKEANPQEVNNSKVTIPQTGGIGSVAVIAAGLLVAGLGLILKRRMAK